MFSGQAFDADYISNPSKKFVQPVTRPDVFDLTVSVKQNFGGNNPKPKGIFFLLLCSFNMPTVVGIEMWSRVNPTKKRASLLLTRPFVFDLTVLR